MATTPTLGRVASLFPHIEKDWWKKAYNEMYLYTDGDCVEVPAITQAECTELLGIPSVQKLLQPQESPVEVLDLCCGQGRHSIGLAKRFPGLNIFGVDQSTYLLGLAKERALAESVQANTNFREGDIRQIPAANSVFDLVILLGNSFGHCGDEGDLQSLREVFRVLKPGGIFVIDYVDGSWIRSNFSKSGWEWLEGEQKLLACRERELSPDQTLLASREIVIDLEGPSIRQDLFYSVRLYDLEEMDSLLRQSGLRIRTEDGMQLITPQRDGPVDMGMMERRQLVVAQKPIQHLPSDTLDHDERVYVHPSLELGHDEHKGQLLKVSSFLAVGTMIIADTPYALVPSFDLSQPGASICSNLGCNRRLSQHTEILRCRDKCIRDVAWCNDACRVADQDRHAFECGWLRTKGETIREKEGQYNFAMLWLIVRVVAGKHLQMQNPSTPTKPYAWEDQFKKGWESIECLTGNLDQWPPAKLQHWKRLVEEYLNTIDQSIASVDEMVGLICKEESNSFGLYPRETGSFLTSDPPIDRGADYGVGIYPRVSLMNHSCIPNVSWRPDNQGEYLDITERQKLLQENFLFSCACDRCTAEQAKDLPPRF
ncbi:unnamed protein product [Penicillium bialowiezense]